MFNSTTTLTTNRTVRAGTIAVAALTALGLSSGLGNQATADTGDNNTNDNQQLSADKYNATAAEALAELKGISISEAKQQLREEHKLDKISDRIEKKLGSSMVGSYIDEQGDLVINVTSKKAGQKVDGTDIETQVVSHSASDLEQVVNHLNRYSENHGSGAVTGWYVDIEANTVIVEKTTGETDEETTKFLKLVRDHGTIVDVEPTTGTPSTAATLYGGQKIWPGYCSVGFNAKDSAGRYVLLTAGHCTVGYPSVSSGGYVIGGTRGYSFPGRDYAVVNNNYPGYWKAQPGVLMYNGYARTVFGYSSAPVGSSVCKSGATTGWTCGVITAYNRTVTYPQGNVYGLVQHTACVEPGDSGGSNISGNYAQGITSGASLTNNKCQQRFGRTNVSWYQPIAPVLSAYNLKLVTSSNR